jgi:uncharacterized membrane protein
MLGRGLGLAIVTALMPKSCGLGLDPATSGLGLATSGLGLVAVVIIFT